jgi:hypothetical protein
MGLLFRLLKHALSVLIILLPLVGLRSGIDGAFAQEMEPATWHGKRNGTEFTVRVIPRGHVISDEDLQTKDWWEWGNTSTDAYLFSFFDAQAINLILDFSTSGSNIQAALYLLGENASRSVEVFQNGYRLPHPMEPDLVVWPGEGQWLTAGEVNFNLEGYRFDERQGFKWHFLVGADQPGRPNWSTDTLENDLHPDRGYTRFSASVLADKNVSYQLADPLMPTWPYLSAGYGKISYGSEATHPLYLNLDTLSFQDPAWVGFQTAGMYQFNSLSYPPYVDFESPFAWYRFDPSFGKFPNLVIRSNSWPPRSAFGPLPLGEQDTSIRMSWTGEKPGYWRYSITTVGNHLMDEKVMVGDTEVRSIPYQELPAWVLSHPWKAVTFVEATRGWFSSEGIYDYSVQNNDPISYWVNGLVDEPPDVFHSPFIAYPTAHPQRLPENLRGEYSLAYNRIPQLYFSPIDNRLHLLYSQGGVWNLGNGLVLRTQNLTGEAYIDGWVLERIPSEKNIDSLDQFRAINGEPEQELYAFPGHLLYAGSDSGSDEVIIKRSDYQLASFELSPPTDELSWDAYRERLLPYDAEERDPNDLSAWLEIVPGESLSIAGAKISGVRMAEGKFRFQLTLEPGFFVQGPDLVELEHLEAGRYEVVYDGQFSIRVLTPPLLNIEILPENLSSQHDIHMPSAILLRLANSGREDTKNLTLVVEAVYQKDQEKTEELLHRQVDVLAGKPLETALSWQPHEVGGWELRSQLEDEAGHVLAAETKVVEVGASDEAGIKEILRASTENGWTLPAILVLVAFAFFAAILVRSALRSADSSHPTE